MGGGGRRRRRRTLGKGRGEAGGSAHLAHWAVLLATGRIATVSLTRRGLVGGARLLQRVNGVLMAAAEQFEGHGLRCAGRGGRVRFWLQRLHVALACEEEGRGACRTGEGAKAGLCKARACC